MNRAEREEAVDEARYYFSPAFISTMFIRVLNVGPALRVCRVQSVCVSVGKSLNCVNLSAPGAFLLVEFQLSVS